MSAASTIPLFSGARSRLATPSDAKRNQYVTVTKGYTLWAANYDRDPNPLLRLEERALEPLLTGLRGKVVLDVACGTGRWLERLLSKGAHRGAGIDLSSDMLLGAKAKMSIRGQVVRGDFLTLPFASNVADLVICSFAVNHASDLAALSRELARVARPEADVFVTDLHPLAHAQGWECAFSLGQRTLIIDTVEHSLDQIRRAFAAEGFEVLRCLEPCLGEPEREVFASAGKGDFFQSACGVPAIFVLHFKRRAVTTSANDLVEGHGH